MFLLRVLFGGAFTMAVAYSLGRVCLWRMRVPRIMALPVGAAILSLCVFVLMWMEAANETSFLALGICGLLPLLWRDKRPNQHPTSDIQHPPFDRITAWILAPVFSAYGVLYLVNALAPEIQPDALYYHLGLVSEYFRLGAFPGRIDFYEILPQGMEMLYLFAFAFGEHPAAKLVHFAFLIGTIPALLAVGRKLGISSRVCWVAAAFYWLSPVVGVSGTSAYTDAALVCCILATFYFLLAWRDERRVLYLGAAGLLAGFCYAIKINALLITALAGLFILIEGRRNPKTALAHSGLLAAAALTMIAPWMIRAVALTGNPMAPLFNAWFPNPYFLAAADRNLAKFLRTYAGFKFSHAPWELTVGGISHGILGPLFLLLPVGLLSLRRTAGCWVWLAGGLLAIPWFVNVGTRFLMPSLPFFALALALALPPRAAWAALVFHAVTCWPAVIGQYRRPELWYLRGFPWKAALRLQSDRDYLHGALWDFPVAEILNRSTKPDGKILALTALPDAYIHREIIQYWQSATGMRLREELLEVVVADGYPVYDWTAQWKAQPLRGLRFRTLAESPFEWEIHEATVLHGENRLPVDPQWRVAAWPDLFEAVFAFDGNQVSRWRTWEATSPGMYLEMEFGKPTTASGVSLATHWPLPQVEIFGKTVDGRWTLLSNQVKAEPRPKENLRREAIRSLRRAGIDYILTPAEGGAHGNLILGKDLVTHAKEYGIAEVGRFEMLRLFRL